MNLVTLTETGVFATEIPTNIHIGHVEEALHRVLAPTFRHKTRS